MIRQLLCGTALATLLGMAAAAAAPLELKRVMLSSGGVGYFEHEATVEGDEALTLEVRLDQVDDVLKSLVVYDDKGSVVSVGLASREPLGQLLRDLPFDAKALDTPRLLFNALQGAELKVGTPRPMTGRILKAEEETVALREGATTTRTRVSLMSAAGLQQFVLEEADGVTFTDPALQAKLADALATIARYHDGGRRTLTLQTRGAERRAVRVGYVVGAPLWKASYRLTFAADPVAEQARVQGWAVLENTTAQDWTGIELTLLSGNPVTFRQALYESYTVQRPEVPVEVVGRVLPKPDEGSLPAETQADQQRRARMQAPQAGAARAFEAPPVPMPAPAPMATAAAVAPQMATVAAADSTEGATQVVFTLPQPVTIGAGRSAVVPLLDRALPAARASWIQAGSTTPMAAVRLTNDSPTGLPPGVLTLYERAAGGATAYVGDARLATFPTGEQRLLSYAVDSKLKLDRSTGEVGAIAGATVADGVLRVSRRLRQTTTWRLAAPAQEPRRVIIEQPRSGGWTLVEPDPKGVTLTPGAWRVPATLKPGETATVTVTLEQPREEVLRILDLDDQRLGAIAAARELDPKLREALGDLARRRQAIAAQEAALKRQQGERDEIVQDQARVRDNLGAVAKGTPLANRLIDKLSQTETRLETLAGAMATTRGEIDKARAALAEQVGKLKL